MPVLYLLILLVPVGALAMITGLDRLEQRLLPAPAQADPRAGLTPGSEAHAAADQD